MQAETARIKAETARLQAEKEAIVEARRRNQWNIYFSPVLILPQVVKSLMKYL